MEAAARFRGFYSIELADKKVTEPYVKGRLEIATLNPE